MAPERVVTELDLQRPVQVWTYTVSFSRLLLRATKDREHDTRVDVLFQGVGAMQVPASMPSLRIREADEAERTEILQTVALDVVHERRFFVLEGPGVTGWVVAGVLVVVEDQGEYDEPSQLIA